MIEQTDQQFVADLIQVQPRLVGYVLAIVPDRNAAADIVQEASMVMWQKRGEFTPGSNFGAWACTVARYQALAYRRNRMRDRHQFSDTFAESLADEGVSAGDQIHDRRRALRDCMAKLPAGQRDLLDRRYSDNQSVTDIAETLGRPVSSLYQTLHRIRAVLMTCVRQTLAEA
ncbi:MAG: sigma-70 family RNA polymerase sigma factor [Phycisphaera sp.]|nr:sigma-70 family RNA polymerase sigma factor [Phycisphaera sp.]